MFADEESYNILARLNKWWDIKYKPKLKIKFSASDAMRFIVKNYKSWFGDYVIWKEQDMIRRKKESLQREKSRQISAYQKFVVDDTEEFLEMEGGEEQDDDNNTSTA
jgi:hypothetical protein